MAYFYASHPFCPRGNLTAYKCTKNRSMFLYELDDRQQTTSLYCLLSFTLCHMLHDKITLLFCMFLQCSWTVNTSAPWREHLLRNRTFPHSWMHWITVNKLYYHYSFLHTFFIHNLSKLQLFFVIVMLCM